MNNYSHGGDSGSGTSSGGTSPLKKVVLLVDLNAQTRESRAKVLRTLGATVHCASSVRDARSRTESGAYNLILVDLGSDTNAAESFAQEIKAKHPRQLVAFLVGSPLFVAKSLRNKIVPRPQAPPSIVPAIVANATTNNEAFDFGQKIKDAEAEEVA